MTTRIIPLRSVAVACFALCSSPVLAYSEGNKTILRVGSQSGNGYVSFTVPPNEVCNWGNIYFDMSTDAGRSYYALLLSAKAAERPLSRVDYNKAADGTCTMTLVEM